MRRTSQWRCLDRALDATLGVNQIMTDNKNVTSAAIACGHCRNRTLMRVAAMHRELLAENEEKSGVDYQLLKCPACDQINLRIVQWDDSAVEALAEDGEDPEFVLGEIVYPPAEKVPDGLPMDLRTAYEEALAVRLSSPNAYAVMLGRVLEAVCVDRKAEGRTLYDQIADLGDRGEIPDTIVQVAHGVRKLRNVGAHAAIGSLGKRDVHVIERLARAVLEYVYTAPRLVRLAERT